jgi:hypothetical protein
MWHLRPLGIPGLVLFVTEYLLSVVGVAVVIVLLRLWDRAFVLFLS